MEKRKLAVFVHGWIAQGKQWGRRKERLLLLLKSFGYDIKILNMPGRYMLPKKGFYYYAEYIAEQIKEIDEASLCPCCHQNWPIDEIVLIAHSMGGVACRLYLQDNKTGDVAIKQKITKLITLASPHHGTSAAIEDLMEDLLGLPELELFHWSKCYKQLAIGSGFIRELNELPFPSTTEFYSIWARGDLVVTPTHTAVSGFAKNHFIAKGYVHHVGVMHSVHTSDIVRDILNGKVNPKGLQKYPKRCNCNSDKKQWIPIFYFSEREESGSNPMSFFSLDEKFLWKCKNSFDGKTCDAEHIQKWMPGLLGCKMGIMKKRLHTWRKTGLKHWVCKKCGTEETDKKHPRKYTHNGCVEPFRNWHRWYLDWSEWRCENCGKTMKSKWTPPVLGCSEGIIQEGKRFHDWYKARNIYLFKFKCSGCGKIVTLQDI